MKEWIFLNAFIANKSYLCLLSLFLVLNNINKVIEYKQIKIVHDCIVISNSSEIELNKFIKEA